MWTDPFIYCICYEDGSNQISLAASDFLSKVLEVLRDVDVLYKSMIQTDPACMINKKHLKNVGPNRHCEPPHAHSPGVASGTVERRLRIDVHDIDNDDNDDDNDNA